MRPLVLTLGTALGLAGLLGGPRPGLAADLPARLSPPLPAPVVAAPPRWAGFHIGAHAGGSHGQVDGRTGFRSMTSAIPGVTAPVTRSATFAGPDLDRWSLHAGARAGVTLQSGLLAYGLEGDFSWLGLDAQTRTAISAARLNAALPGAITGPLNGFVGTRRQEVDWLSTLRGRVGLATDRAFVYATGGLAIADTAERTRYIGLIDGALTPVARQTSGTRVGWTVGAGAEAALAPNTSVTLEYLYADLGARNRNLGTYIAIPNLFRQTASSAEDLTIHTIRLGLNYRFSSVP